MVAYKLTGEWLIHTSIYVLRGISGWGIFYVANIIDFGILPYMI